MGMSTSDINVTSPGWYSPLRSTGDFKGVKPIGSRGGSRIDFKTHIENLQQEEINKRN